MSLSYDKEYTNVFHSPGIEPWITGFLKSKRYKVALDLGCGLGFMSLILKLYLKNIEYLVGLDISREKLIKTKELNLYDDLLLADARVPPFRNRTFDLVVSIEVLHGLPRHVLEELETLSRNSMVLTLPTLPKGIGVSYFAERGYRCYRYLLRGFILVGLNDYKILLALDSRFFKVARFFLYLLKPILKAIKFFERGYILAFK